MSDKLGLPHLPPITTESSVRSAKDSITADAMAELRDLLPKGIAVNAAWKKNLEEIKDVLYTLYVAGEENGDQDGYDRGYDDGYADGQDEPNPEDE
jgi:hypothetical protein